ncbi:MAG: UTP--glucose-1-phosphate uridylyltransferase [Phycisphaerales bacterium]
MHSTGTEDRLAGLAPLLDAAGQSHLVRWCEQLDADARERLLEQLAELDLPLLARLASGDGHAGVDSAELLPPETVDASDPAALDRRAAGENLLREGKVAAFTVAGGQGTRLGWNGPKGTFPATVIAGKPLFRVFAEQILATQDRFAPSEPIPWYVMTSPANDADTQAFFRDNNWFGLAPGQVSFLVQGTMPSVDFEGRVLLESREALCLSPDGHGGSLRALRRSGALEEMAARGIEQISYFQVDNPLVRILDPLFLGFHAADPRSSGEMSGKMVPKRHAGEKVGVFCQRGGRTAVVEYSDLPAELAEATDPQGRLKFRAGNIAVHAISVEFATRLTEEGSAIGLPYHRAIKKVPHLDLASGKVVSPAEPNAIKFETFVFDAMPLAKRALVMETSRLEEFAPIKNASGEDSAESSRQAQSDRAASWLEARGVKVARHADGHAAAKIEIEPRTALCAADLAMRPLPDRIDPGSEVLI